MPTVVGVSFHEAGRIYHFEPGGLAVRRGDWVIAETARGMELGMVKTDPKEVPLAELVHPLRCLVRIATEEDLAQHRENQARDQEAFEICAAKIAKHGLPMRLLRAHYTFDRSRVVFFFSAEGRVDFRELVKDLAATLRTRIELHQVGARDAARLFGGFGRCGRELCCVKWLNNLQPVSIRMAKDQDLALNPAKFSGQCGKLMCCLRYEVDSYREAQQSLPQVGTIVQTPSGEARVVDINVPGERVRLEYLETGAHVSLSVAEFCDWVTPPCPHDECTGGDTKATNQTV